MVAEGEDWKDVDLPSDAVADRFVSGFIINGCLHLKVSIHLHVCIYTVHVCVYIHCTCTMYIHCTCMCRVV